MARYCANDSCQMSSHPLSPQGGPCPECGSARYRLKPDVATTDCPACDRPNETTNQSCWSCGASLNHRRAVR